MVNCHGDDTVHGERAPGVYISAGISHQVAGDEGRTGRQVKEESKGSAGATKSPWDTSPSLGERSGSKAEATL